MPGGHSVTTAERAGEFRRAHAQGDNAGVTFEFCIVHVERSAAGSCASCRMWLCAECLRACPACRSFAAEKADRKVRRMVAATAVAALAHVGWYGVALRSV